MENSVATPRQALAFLLIALAFIGCSRGDAAVSAKAEQVPRADEPAKDKGGTSTESAQPAKSAGTTNSSKTIKPAKMKPVMLKPAIIRDPARNNMPAHRILVPQGWALEGGITRLGAGYHMLPFASDVTVKAPDKRGARFFGMQEFGYADGVQLAPFSPYQGRPFFPIQPSLGEFWKRAFSIAPAPGVTGLKIVSEEVMPDATKLARKQLAEMYRATEKENAQLAFSGQQMSFDVHVRRLVIQYDENGTSIEATVFATVRHTIYRYSNGVIRAAMWNLDNMYAVFGPAGTDYLDDPVLATIVRSRQELPDWQTAIQQWYLAKNRQIVADGQARIAAMARAAATTRSSQSQDILDISFNGWKERNAARDAGHSATINGIHERTTYATPSGNTIDLPSHYQNAYADKLGNYVLHNDANYQINTDPAFNSREWERIEPVR